MTTEVEEPPKKLTLRPQMGLADVQADALPWLQVTVKNKRNQPLSNVQVKLTALCITPDEHNIIYAECVATSSATAHAIMAALNEADNTQQNWAFCQTPTQGYNIHPGDNMRVADTKLALKGHSGLHHFALLAQDEDFILARDDQQLWQKLRKKMTCPTQDHWGTVLLPQVLEAGLMVPCESFGLPPGLAVYVLELDSDAQFDELVGSHVREHGL